MILYIKTGRWKEKGIKRLKLDYTQKQFDVKNTKNL